MDSIVNYFEKEFNLSEIEKAKLEYSLNVLFTDISKLLILFIIFSIFGKVKEFLFSMLALLSIRPFTGGLHFNTYLGCFIFTGLFFSSVITLYNLVALSNYSTFIFAFSFITTLTIAPIIHKNRPSYSKHKLKQFKVMGLANISIHFLLYFLAPENPYLNISAWVILLQSIQLIIKKGVEIFEKKNSKVIM
ncbi:MAG: accessory gene regulator B family protein [Tissierellia bacterium]|nr:accessory gene regulator B family protein [Tissierellia bacterium]MDD4726490.1 accessory gene regulator B family protein [Tissierellia bacterium]